CPAGPPTRTSPSTRPTTPSWRPPHQVEAATTGSSRRTEWSRRTKWGPEQQAAARSEGHRTNGYAPKWRTRAVAVAPAPARTPSPAVPGSPRRASGVGKASQVTDGSAGGECAASVAGRLDGRQEGRADAVAFQFGDGGDGGAARGGDRFAQDDRVFAGVAEHDGGAHDRLGDHVERRRPRHAEQDPGVDHRLDQVEEVG